MTPTLQVAIDDPNLQKFEGVVKSLAKTQADLIEIGTPLITAFGLGIFRKFLKHLDADRIYVDVKCLDLWDKQLLPFVEAGAKHLSIHALLEAPQAKKLLALAGKRGITIYVSALGLSLEAANEANIRLFTLGYRNFIMHGEGIDPNEAFSRAIDKLQRSTLPSSANLILAGGVNAENILMARQRPISGVIVGRSVMESPEPVKSIERLREILTHDQSG
ncbi:orotidine 5'-phosphate decarboxylase / HUMPS family protein [Caballeronia sp. LZ032]|uniref:orotidine 5'-phosphate decarboxylase / HUMPS family protein n=1 Tax=Caballeronia sp. LZ032 TaxID=3038565 RepID=UPI0038D3A22D